MYQRIDFEEYNFTLGELAEIGYPLFDDTWDTYVPEYKQALCEKIKRYYWFNQIGAETPDRFKHFLNAELERIMPYYNQLYASTLIEFDPMINYAVKTQGRKIENLARVANTDSSSIGKALRSFANSSNKDGSLKGNLTGDYGKNVDRDITTNITKETTEAEKKVGTEDITDTTDVTKNGSGGESGNSTETRDISNGKTTLYSDTPQKDLSKNSIRWDYLTNATNESGSEDMSDKINSEREYTNTETTEGTDKRDRDWTEDTDTSKDESQKETTSDVTTEKADKSEDTTQSTNEKTSENGSENNMDSKASASTVDEKHTIDEGENRDVSGVMNVSQSDLLKAFRDTFVNVDDKILKDLRFLFMEVF